jgi:hypothetical protein
MAQGYQYKPYNPIPPRQSAEDFSYWGMNKQPTESLPSSLAQAASQRGREIGNTIRNEWQKFQEGPSLAEVTANRERYYEENPQEMPDWKEVVMGGVETAVDWMNPLPISGLGTIASKGAKSFSDDLVKETKRLIREEGLTKEAATARTGYYQDSAGNWKTQFSDVGSEVSDAEVRRVADMAFGPNSKALREMEYASPMNQRQLTTVFKHPKLFEEYPWLAAKGKVQYTDDVSYAAMEPMFNKQTGELLSAKILINPKGVRDYAKTMGITYKEAMRTMILHESNHMIQALDKLPAGSNKDWYKKMRLGIDLYEKKANEIRGIVRQMPPSAPRTKELKAELAELDKHIDFVKNTKDVDAGVLYRHTTGEADSFWVQTMKDVEHPEKMIPAHERTENPRLMQEAPGGQAAALPYQAKFRSTLTPEYTAALQLPKQDVAALEARWGKAKQAERAQKALMRDLGYSNVDLGHSSPYSFKQFDLGHAGSGEGAAAYGHGVYLWENPKVGEWYRKNFQSGLDAQKGALSSQRRALEQKLNQPRGISNEEALKLRRTIRELRTAEEAGDYTAKVYDVEVPDEVLDRVMDWNKPLKEQSETVQAGINKLSRRIYDSEGLERMNNYTVEEIYRDLAEVLGSQEAASQALRRKGIVGHRYLDGDSRLATHGTTNYVIFDDKIPKIRGMK